MRPNGRRICCRMGRRCRALSLSKSYESLFFHKPFQTVYLSLFLRQIPHTQPQNIVNVICRAMQKFHGQMNVLKTEMERWGKTESTVMMMAGSKERLERMRRVLHDYGIDEPTMVEGNLQSGFEMPSIHLVVITEGEMFTQKQRKARKVDKKIENAERIKSYTELKVGDYVVHVNHGIGKYVGIGTLEIAGIHKDYCIFCMPAAISCPCRLNRLISCRNMSAPRKAKIRRYISLAAPTGTGRRARRAPPSRILPTS